MPFKVLRGVEGAAAAGFGAGVEGAGVPGAGAHGARAAVELLFRTALSQSVAEVANNLSLSVSGSMASVRPEQG